MKLEKISLRNMSDNLTDNEMKATLGGGYGGCMKLTCWVNNQLRAMTVYGQSLDCHYIGERECDHDYSYICSPC